MHRRSRLCVEKTVLFSVSVGITEHDVLVGAEPWRNELNLGDEQSFI